MAIIVAGHVDLVGNQGDTIEPHTPLALGRCGLPHPMRFCDGIEPGPMKVCQRAQEVL
ncbi:MAG: CDGSH iron-sulfur domain-containing protein [Syntrophomonadaceae bacterium]|nr:CDGSH iron-sulfur domain-containing protein [Syntrophomonadaceae bacterium]